MSETGLTVMDRINSGFQVHIHSTAFYSATARQDPVQRALFSYAVGDATCDAGRRPDLTDTNIQIGAIVPGQAQPFAVQAIRYRVEGGSEEDRSAYVDATTLSLKAGTLTLDEIPLSLFWRLPSEASVEGVWLYAETSRVQLPADLSKWEIKLNTYREVKLQGDLKVRVQLLGRLAENEQGIFNLPKTPEVTPTQEATP